MACSPYYYKNLVGLKCTDDEMERIPMARLELMQHVTLKTTQALGILGAGVAAPVMTLVKSDSESRMTDLKQRSFEYGKNGIIAGLVIGPLITSAFLVGKPYDGVYDRCFRIRHHQTQLRIDRFSFLGLAVGLGACQALGESLDKGAVFGYLGGFVVGAFLNRVL